MANLVSRQVFEIVKTPDVVLFLDRRPNSALDLLTLFALRRHAADPSRTAVHILSSERSATFWKDRLVPVPNDRLYIHDLSRDPFCENGLFSDEDRRSLLDSVRRYGPSCSRHVVILDSSSFLLAHHVKSLCTFVATLAKQIAEETQENAQTSVGILHHSDVFGAHSERALKFVSSTVITLLASHSHTKPGQCDFDCSVDHLRHQNGHTVQMERITISDDWRPNYTQTDNLSTRGRPTVKTESTDPASNLSFNLRLTTEERTARNQVQLPHSHGGSVIYYEPDEADDIDYEDPDE